MSNLNLVVSVVFVVALVAMVGTKLWLASRQIRHVAANRNDVPQQFTGTIALAAHQRAADYTVERTRLTMIEVVVSAARARRADAARRRAAARSRDHRLARARLPRADRAGGVGDRDHQRRRPAVRLHPALCDRREIRLQPDDEEALFRRSREGRAARRRGRLAAAVRHALADEPGRRAVVAVDVDGLGRVPVARDDPLSDVHRAAFQQVRAAQGRSAARPHRKPDVAHAASPRRGCS